MGIAGKLWLFGLILIPIMIVSCSPSENLINTEITQPQSKLPTNTLEPTNTLRPTPTLTQTPRPTDTQTQSITTEITYTPKPTATSDILKFLEEVGIEFTENTTSYLKSDYGEFSLGLSNGILARSGVAYAKLPMEVLERMYLHAMGRYMFFSRNEDKQRYEVFNTILPDIQNSTEESQWADWPIFREVAERLLMEGPVLLNIKPVLSETTANEKGLIAEVKNLNMKFVKKDEFKEVLNILSESGIAYYRSGPLIVGPDKDAVIFFNGDSIEVISYYFGFPEIHGGKPEYGDPLELMDSEYDFLFLYAGIIRLFSETLAITQRNFLHFEDVGIIPPPEADVIRFEADELHCGVIIHTSAKARECEDKAYLTFNP